ncbi:hypothetical protein BH18CHL1_BH18CHL1_03940 [soil metagenome]
MTVSISTIGQGPYVAVASIDERIVVQRHVPTDVARLELEQGVPGQRLEPVSLPDDASCRFTRWEKPARLPDGRVSLLQYCLTMDDRFQWELVAVELLSMAIETLGSPGMDIQAYSWRPGLEEGWFSAGSLICEGIGGLVDGNVEYLDHVVLEEGDAKYSLGDTLRTLDGPNCPGAPRAGWPDWSPDGQVVAFLASWPRGSASTAWMRRGPSGPTMPGQERRGDFSPSSTTRGRCTGHRTADHWRSERR